MSERLGVGVIYRELRLSNNTTFEYQVTLNPGDAVVFTQIPINLLNDDEYLLRAQEVNGTEAQQRGIYVCTGDTLLYFIDSTERLGTLVSGVHYDEIAEALMLYDFSNGTLDILAAANCVHPLTTHQTAWNGISDTQYIMWGRNMIDTMFLRSALNDSQISGGSEWRSE